MNSCCGSITKYLVFIANLLIFLLGCLILGFGIFAIVTNNNDDVTIFGGNSPTGRVNSNVAEIILVVVSSVIIIVSFLGCCGAILENRAVIFIYFTIMLLTTVFTTIGSTLVFSKSVEDLKDPLLSSLQRYDRNSSDAVQLEITQAWDKVQRESSCCGVHDFEDWSKFSTVFPDSLGHQVPSSCCSGLDLDEDETLECQSRPSEQKFAKRLHGCFSALTISWQGQEGIVGYIAIAIVAIMVINLVVLFSFALCLAPNKAGYQQV